MRCHYLLPFTVVETPAESIFDSLQGKGKLIKENQAKEALVNSFGRLFSS
jgi:hypothetical protein